MTSSSKLALALGLAGATALASPSFAGPVLSSTTGVKAAASDNMVDVQYRRWHHHRGGAGLAAGLAFGALAGAAVGAATAPYYYGYPAYSYGYSAPAYGSYAYEAPVTYYGARGYGSAYYPYQTCGVSAGYGRWDYSQC
jgi:hypothetical protein